LKEGEGRGGFSVGEEKGIVEKGALSLPRAHCLGKKKATKHEEFFVSSLIERGKRGGGGGTTEKGKWAPPPLGGKRFSYPSAREK